MKIEDVSEVELQLMRLKVEKPAVLARFFEGNEDETRYYIMNVSLPPVTFVREMDLDLIAKLILKRGYKESANELGVSEAFLRKVVRDKIDANHGRVSLFRDITDDFMEPVSIEKLVEMSRRVPFMRLLEAISHWKEAKIKKVVKTEVIGSNLSSSKGRKAELFYKQVRNGNVLRDLNQEENNPPYDFDDKVYGKVDVKSSRQFSTKTDGDRWYFSLKSSICDWFCLVGYDAMYEVPLFVMMVKRNQDENIRPFLVSQESLRLSSEMIIYNRVMERMVI